MDLRINRALSQRIHLIRQKSEKVFHVAGLTSDYYVLLSDIGAAGHCCTCPDFKNRQKPCKHIFFILFRVLRLKKDDWLRNNDLLPSKWNVAKPKFEVATAIELNKRKRLEVQDEECSICYEAFVNTKNDPVTYCNNCGHCFHSGCMRIWLRHSCEKNCPQCRCIIRVVKHFRGNKS